MSDNYSDSSHPQPKETVDESRLHTPQAKKTVVEENFFSPQPKKTVDESRLHTPQVKKTVVESDPNKSPRRNTFVRKDPLEGKTIGDNNRYLLQTLLGKGGMSKVYQALDTKFEDRRVAIKLMTNYSGANSQHLIKRFMAEVRAISGLKHPNIIQIFDFGVTPKEAPFYRAPFYVMEYFAGKTLQDLLGKNKTVPLESLLKIVRQVCAGLKEAHRKGLVHRDLKPDNIFLVAGGAFGEIVKILDFGIAKNISSEAKNQTQLTQAGSFIGTYRYASPEQCRGLPNIDQRTDIYSLGVILYEAICGSNPYNLTEDFSTTEADWIACHIRVTPKPLKEQSGFENIQDDLNDLVMKCLEKSPDRRFSDIEELRKSLNNILLPTTEEPPVQLPPLPTIVENKEEKNERDLSPKPNFSSNRDAKSDRDSTSGKQGKKIGKIAGIAIVLTGILGAGGYFLYDRFMGTKPVVVTDNQPIDKTPEKTEPATNNNSLLLEKLADRYESKNYQECYQLALDNSRQNYLEMNEWLGKCGLAAAKVKAEANSYTGAIAIAKEIPHTVPNYQEIQDSIKIWSGKILDYANTVYKNEGIEKAIKVTQVIPDNSSTKSKVTELISQWEKTDKQYQDTINLGQQLLNEKAWYVAKQEIEKIPTDFKFWRAKAQPVLDRANEGIKNYKPPVTKTPVRKTPVRKTPVTRTPVRKTPVRKTPVTRTPVRKPPVTKPPTVIECNGFDNCR